MGRHFSTVLDVSVYATAGGELGGRMGLSDTALPLALVEIGELSLSRVSRKPAPSKLGGFVGGGAHRGLLGAVPIGNDRGLVSVGYGRLRVLLGAEAF
jgi:hypothetical protein